LNKVDLPSANPEEVSDDIIDLLGCKLEDIIHASGKLVLCRKYIGRHHRKFHHHQRGGRALQLIFDSL
jgi:hypothetical protein